MRKSLKQTEILDRADNLKPKFISTELITYKRDDKIKYWEKTIMHDTVHILVKNTDTNKLLLVRQTRIPVLVNNDKHSSNGETFEACAGIIDKYEDYNQVPNRRAKMIAAEEVREELGYQLKLDSKLESLTPFIGSTGSSGSKCYPFYAEVSNSLFIGQDLEPDEDIIVFELPVDEIREFLNTISNIDAVTRFLLQWYLLNK